MLFIYGVHKERGRGNHKILGNFAMVVDGVLGGVDFSDTLNLLKSKKKKLFIISFLLHFC